MRLSPARERKVRGVQGVRDSQFEAVGHPGGVDWVGALSMDHELAPRLPPGHLHAQRMHEGIEFNALNARHVDMDTSKWRTENDLSGADVNAEKEKERPASIRRNETQEN